MVSEKRLKKELCDINIRSQHLLDGVGPERLGQRADPAKWSIAECLAHLNLTARVVQPAIETSLERGKQRKITGTGPFPPGAIGAFMTWFDEPPLKLRIRAPKMIAPRIEAGDVPQVVPEFWRLHAEWDRLLSGAAGLDLGRITAKPFPVPLSFRLAGLFAFMFAHERRHLFQAENVKKELAA